MKHLIIVTVTINLSTLLTLIPNIFNHFFIYKNIFFLCLFPFINNYLFAFAILQKLTNQEKIIYLLLANFAVV